MLLYECRSQLLCGSENERFAVPLTMYYRLANSRHHPSPHFHLENAHPNLNLIHPS